MNSLDTSLWAAMAGALMLMLVAAVGDLVRTRSLPAFRGVAFVALTGASAVLMSGLPELLLGINDESVLLPAKLAMPPLSGALTLTYLGLWLGVPTNGQGADRWIFMVSAITTLAGMGLMLASLVSDHLLPQYLLIASAVIIALPIALSLILTLRYARMGDALAGWMTLAAVLMTVMITGLYSQALHLDLGPMLEAVTAISTIAFFVITTVLTLQRNAMQAKLKRIAQGNTATDAVTGLPTGSVLLSKVDDALWRGARVGKDSAVLALWVHNLYALNEEAGIEAEHEIRARLTAVLRQAVGFRNTVGLLQPRCFVVVVSAVASEQQLDQMMQRLLAVGRPMKLGFLTGEPTVFVPQLSVGCVRIGAANHGNSLAMMDLAQSLAQSAGDAPERILTQSITG